MYPELHRSHLHLRCRGRLKWTRTLLHLSPGSSQRLVHMSTTPVELFKKTVQTLCDNSNIQAAKQQVNGKKYKWSDLSPVVFDQ
ncbi:hypothetical protein EYF80_023863 [Liparis tanakae]|uniref:Uncharacterized protein n=1 Tax=Liparis tanakae TaxID=230148 RepID=A0A4Z2HLJ2_9TELE|nr:hypothetical protein EYF80_023863 [Liparis tanakae]